VTVQPNGGLFSARYTVTYGAFVGEIHGHRGRARRKVYPIMAEQDDLVLAVETLSIVQDRYDAAHSDPTGTSSGDDGESADTLNHPE
jgi:hypothetical protein